MSEPASLLTFADIERMATPPGGSRESYGSAPLQFGVLHVPPADSAGSPTRLPAMMIVHGGCWQSKYDFRYALHLAHWLGARGFVTWTIEYRRLGDPGGGWPGTFQDVACAFDHLRLLADRAPIDLARCYVAGHSAGGQLALWLAARPRSNPAGPLFEPRPLPPAGVLALAPIVDLESYRFGPEGSCHASVEELLGGAPAAQPERYAQTSPVRCLPLGVPQALVQGARDPIVAAASVAAYAETTERAGDPVRLTLVEEAGHFEVALPVARSEAALADALAWLVAAPPHG